MCNMYANNNFRTNTKQNYFLIRENNFINQTKTSIFFLRWILYSSITLIILFPFGLAHKIHLRIIQSVSQLQIMLMACIQASMLYFELSKAIRGIEEWLVNFNHFKWSVGEHYSLMVQRISFLLIKSVFLFVICFFFK